jgi:hypothetical protein
VCVGRYECGGVAIGRAGVVVLVNVGAGEGAALSVAEAPLVAGAVTVVVVLAFVLTVALTVLPGAALAVTTVPGCGAAAELAPDAGAEDGPAEDEVDAEPDAKAAGSALSLLEHPAAVTARITKAGRAAQLVSRVRGMCALNLRGACCGGQGGQGPGWDMRALLKAL